MTSSPSQSVDARLKEAAILLVTEQGLAGLSVSAICARAAVAEARFHERWTDEWAVFLAALDERMRLPTLPDTGRLADDLVAYTQGHLRLAGDPSFAALILYLLAEARSDAGLQKKLGAGFFDRRVRNLQLIDRAVARGELPPGVDGNAILDGLLGRHIALLGAGRTPPETEIRALVEKLIAEACSASGPAPKRRATSSAGPYRLYLFETSPAMAKGRMTEVQSLKSLCDDDAIAEANARRGGRYAELWKADHLLRILDPD